MKFSVATWEPAISWNASVCSPVAQERLSPGFSVPAPFVPPAGALQEEWVMSPELELVIWTPIPPVSASTVTRSGR